MIKIDLDVCASKSVFYARFRNFPIGIFILVYFLCIYGKVQANLSLIYIGYYFFLHQFQATRIWSQYFIHFYVMET